MHTFAQVNVMGEDRCSAAIDVARDPDLCRGSVTSFTGGP